MLEYVFLYTVLTISTSHHDPCFCIHFHTANSDAGNGNMVHRKVNVAVQCIHIHLSQST